MREYKKQILMCAVFISIIFIILFFTFGTNHKKDKSNKDNSSQEASTQVKTSDEKCTAMVLKINYDKNEIRLINIEKQTQSVYLYSGKTDVRDKYDKVMSIDRIKIGDIFDIGYLKSTGELEYMYESSKAWEYKDIDNFEVTNNGEGFSFNEEKYKLDKDYLVLNNDEIVDIYTLGDNDIVTVRGVGKSVCAIIITTGHGNILLDNYSDFINGQFSIDNRLTYEITKGMSVEASEGEHYVEINNGEKVARTNFTLKRNEDYVIDIEKCDIEENKYGMVKFNIEPDGARLYINGRLYSYNKSFKMSYGTYSINVECTGYKVYSDKVTIDKDSETITVNLEKTEDDADNISTSSPKPSTSPIQSISPRLTPNPLPTKSPSLTEGPTSSPITSLSSNYLVDLLNDILASTTHTPTVN